MATEDEIKRLAWNISDAKEALQCAVGMGDWRGVIKYAEQLKVLCADHFFATQPIPMWYPDPITQQFTVKA